MFPEIRWSLNIFSASVLLNKKPPDLQSYFYDSTFWDKKNQLDCAK